jgi:2-methylaconitate cis-trans-isomerase PrpF
MGIPGSAATPKIAVVTAPVPFVALDGTAYEAGAADVVGRAISMGNCHRAFPLTSSMCLAVAARIEGSLVHEVSTAEPGADVRLGHPSGVLPLDAAVTRPGGDYHADRVTVYRTARRLMEGRIRIP